MLAECIVFMSLFLLHVLGYFDFFIGIFFTINSDFDRPERKGHGAKVPGSEMARERIGQGAKVPRSELARVLLADSLPGQLAPWPFRSLAISLPGTFAPWPFCSGRFISAMS